MEKVLKQQTQQQQNKATNNTKINIKTDLLNTPATTATATIIINTNEATELILDQNVKSGARELFKSYYNFPRETDETNSMELGIEARTNTNSLPKCKISTIPTSTTSKTSTSTTEQTEANTKTHRRGNQNYIGNNGHNDKYITSNSDNTNINDNNNNNNSNKNYAISKNIQESFLSLPKLTVNSINQLSARSTSALLSYLPAFFDFIPDSTRRHIVGSTAIQKIRQLLRYGGNNNDENGLTHYHHHHNHHHQQHQYHCSNISSCVSFDTRNFFYVALFILFYCSLLIRASATTTTTTTIAASTSSAKTITKTISETSTQTPTTPTLIPPPTTLSLSNGIGNLSTITVPTMEINTISVDAMETHSAIGTLMPVLASPWTTKLDPNNLTHRLYRRGAANVPDDDDDSNYRDDDFDEYDALVNNKSAKGKYIGAPCNEMKCDSTLLHVICDKETLTCGCDKNYPVQLGLTKGCDKPKKLGEQCFYDVTCMFSDENSLCVQVRHNAMCQCASGYHSVSYTKPTRRVFCTQDLKELASDLPTLLGVTTGIAVLAGLICMVLHLFSKTKYPRHRNFGDANIPPPIMYSSDTAIPLTVQSGRPSSRSSLRSSGSIGSYGNRRSSSGGVIGGGAGTSSGSKGILVSTSRTGSRRPSLASVHSTSSSVRSYSMMRFEKETQQKEIRQEMKLRLARLQQQQHMSQNKPQIIIGDTLSMLTGRTDHGASSSSAAMTALSRLTMATPSPLTPNSTDELLPSVDELQEYPLKSEMLPMTSTKSRDINVASATLTAVKEIATTTTLPTIALGTTAESQSASSAVNPIRQLSSAQLTDAGAYIGPCSSSTEAL